MNSTAVIVKKNDGWYSLTWDEYFKSVLKISSGLHQLGVKEADKIAIISNTRYEWAVLDMAILCLKAITVPVYFSCTNEEISFIIEDSQVSILIFEKPEQLERWKKLADRFPQVTHVICIEEPSVKQTRHGRGPKIENKIGESQVLFWNELEKKGNTDYQSNLDFFYHSVKSINEKDLATIIYTSGTTGRSRGVLITHQQIMAAVVPLTESLSIQAEDVSLTFLPFAHALGRVEVWGHVHLKYTMGYAVDLESIAENIKVIRPTFIVGVPRIFEKIYNRIQTQVEISKIRKHVFDWAVNIGKIAASFQRARKPVPMDILLKLPLAQSLVLDKILDFFGGRLRMALCGGAPLNKTISEFFHAAGLLLLEGYGLTETTAAGTCNTPFEYEFGTVGKPLPGIEIKFKEDGEILIKGNSVMKGYHHINDQPFEEGYFVTGDIGHMNERGYLIITDRKKDLIKTAGGKYVAPQKLESLFLQSPLISNVLIHGEYRKHIVALLCLDETVIKKFASENDISYKDFATLTKDYRVRRLVREAVAQVNSHLASWETIKNFSILPHDFSVETGELTPSLKVKRKFCDQKYKKNIDQLYGNSES